MSVILLDPKVVEELKELLEGEFNLLVSTYIEDTQDNVIRLRQAIEQQDAEKIYAVAHSIKGASLNLGALWLSEYCLQVEKAARVGDISVGQRLVDEIEDKSAETANLLTTYL